MTSIIMDEGNWGERRAGQRVARRRHRRGWLVAAGLALAVGAPFLAGFVDGFAGREVVGDPPRVVEVVASLLFAAFAAVLARRNWLELDEVERARALSAWTAIGMTALIALPLLHAAQPLLHLADPAQAAWLLTLVAGVLAHLYQRVRA